MCKIRASSLPEKIETMTSDFPGKMRVFPVLTPTFPSVPLKHLAFPPKQNLYLYLWIEQ